ncbi:hypothetical protein C0J52_25709 [Blattella germanica]|nr:hypothetical protein C0J52_25709 [Blattella germanica]
MLLSLEKCTWKYYAHQFCQAYVRFMELMKRSSSTGRGATSLPPSRTSFPAGTLDWSKRAH